MKDRRLNYIDPSIDSVAVKFLIPRFFNKAFYIAVLIDFNETVG